MSTQNTATAFIFEQITHWINTPQNHYLGSNYGIDLRQYLFTPMTQNIADLVIDKMRQDIPILNSVAEGSLNIYANNQDFETKIIIIEVDGMAVQYDLQEIVSRGFGDEIIPNEQNARIY